MLCLCERLKLHCFCCAGACLPDVVANCVSFELQGVGHRHRILRCDLIGWLGHAWSLLHPRQVVATPHLRMFAADQPSQLQPASIQIYSEITLSRFLLHCHTEETTTLPHAHCRTVREVITPSSRENNNHNIQWNLYRLQLDFHYFWTSQLY